ncbi:hypothetical protein PGIGA_G00076200 [Pangasianodon gigas]|uniref:Uncharacterized protein n=1 Tax=Pangasianodon gigas TaxID=30993 RepID=A0ACC5X8K9_PANGG|nr:hypothetical protein [Pangasianodon gigas]
MFKKKTGLVLPASEANVAAEVQIVPAVETESQKSKPAPASVEVNGTQAKAPTVSVEAAGIQVSATTVSAEQKLPAESSTPAKDAPKQVFSKMFKKKTGLVLPSSEANVAAEVQIVPAVETESQKSPNATKLIGCRFTVQVDNDPKHTAKATQDFLKAKKWNILQWPSQSPDLNPIEHAFHLLKTRLKAERPTNKQQLKVAAVKARQSISREETQNLNFENMGSRLQAVIDCKGFSSRY